MKSVVWFVVLFVALMGAAFGLERLGVHMILSGTLILLSAVIVALSPARQNQ